jgi:hypothetical protein
VTENSRESIRLIQSGLDKLGHSPGAIDGGLWGLRTARAIKALLATNGRAASVAPPGPLPWITEAKTALGRHEARGRSWLMDWLKRDGRTLGDPSKNPWCGDFLETCIRVALPGEPMFGALAATEPMLITQPFKNALGSMSLLAVPAEILLQPLINEPCETIQFGPLDIGRPLISRRDRKTHHLLHACTRYPKMKSSSPFAHTGAQVAGLRCRAEIAPRHIGNHARAKGCRWCGLLNVHRNVLCQSRQNHLDQQHTPNTKTRATNSYAAQHPPQAPLSRSDLVHGPLKSTHAFPLKAAFCTAAWLLRARSGQAVLPFCLRSSSLCVQSRSWRAQNR